MRNEADGGVKKKSFGNYFAQFNEDVPVAITNKKCHMARIELTHTLTVSVLIGLSRSNEMVDASTYFGPRGGSQFEGLTRLGDDDARCVLAFSSATQFGTLHKPRTSVPFYIGLSRLPLPHPPLGLP
jgi:hypothetical protein